ncbi:TetR/AcrR family transcriptional regulator [Gordonia sp. NB41Y]|uniref:TetR/AcrR family transcriptional regulator n=1 Tax=Gordonia sp. NB41Y TaxID=875808 RepID=UPI0006B21672|nr:TetR/AcrR family transcriptional regulator [Gordonia sp. NB41Y]KOY49215.1 TetR family transcriptional regulator [Gordonia sp. NB41Y]WLP92428.1 TetR/AcrR family transcriptional regulator [Gordonia sp. NB41Y]
MTDAVSAEATVPDWRVYPPMELPRILEVALTEIVEHGYDATSVRTIAREVGVTVPALYYHYENKQAILVALLEHAMTTVGGHIDGALADAGDDPVRRLSAVVEATALYMATYRDLAFLDSERRSLTPENRVRYAGHRDRIDGLLRSAIEDGCRTGIFATPVPDSARRAIFTMCQGIATWYRPDGPRTPTETARDYVRIALSAVECRDVRGD